MNNILITSAGQRVSLVRAFQYELKRLIPSAKVFTVDLNPILAPACHISDGYSQVPRVTDEKYIKELLSICIKRGIKLIIPTIDTELKVLVDNLSEFEEKGISVVISESDFIYSCRDKRIINDFFTTVGIDIPKPIDIKYPTFPLFIKPYDGSLSKDIYLIKNIEELSEYHYSNPKFMYMEYVDPKLHDEYTVDTYYDKNYKLVCAVPRKRIFVRAGEINKGVTRKNLILSYVKSKLSNIDGARGCLTMQFFMNKETNRIIGIEINPRFGGGYPLSYKSGANYPLYIIKEYLFHESLSYNEDWEDNLLMLRYDDEVLVHEYEQ